MSVADAVVVLGHRPPLRGTEVEPETQARVERGVSLWRSGRAPQLVMTGGPSTRHAIEADVMAAYARERGVPPSQLLRERESLDTIENARNTLALLRTRLGQKRAPRVILVTSDYHIRRATRLFRCAGAHVEPEPVLLAGTRAERRARLRAERWVGVYYWFIDECGRARGE
jgi:uncharacterized SAM-binding protein YcdF (DUF218 family)